MAQNTKNITKKTTKFPVERKIILLMVFALLAGMFFSIVRLAIVEKPEEVSFKGILNWLSGKAEMKALDLPVDKDGNNLYGNLPENIDNGGFFTSQGDRLFFSNLEDDGKLYTAKIGQKAYALTDFAVANLNVCGDRLFFTDLSACLFEQIDLDTKSDNFGKLKETYLMKADSPLAAIEHANENDANITFGGSLYCVTGILSLNENSDDFDDIEIFKTTDNFHYKMYLMQGELVSVCIKNNASTGLEKFGKAQLSAQNIPGEKVSLSNTTNSYKYSFSELDSSFVVFNQEGNIQDIDLLDDPASKVIDMKIYDEIAYIEVETQEGNIFTNANKRIIVRYDLKENIVKDIFDAYNMQSDGDKLYFIDNTDQIIYEHIPNTDIMRPVSRAKCTGTFQLIDGKIIYYEYDASGNPVRIVLRKEYRSSVDNDPLINDAQPSDSMGEWDLYSQKYEQIKNDYKIRQRIGEDIYQWDFFDYIWVLDEEEIEEEEENFRGVGGVWISRRLPIPYPYPDPKRKPTPKKITNIDGDNIPPYNEGPGNLPNDPSNDSPDNSPIETKPAGETIPPDNSDNSTDNKDIKGLMPSTPDLALEVILHTLQGYDYGSSLINNYYSSENYEKLLDYYPDDGRLQVESAFDEHIGMLTELTGDSANSKDVVDSITFNILLADFYIADVEYDDDNDIFATVKVISTKRTDLGALLESGMDPETLVMEKIRENPELLNELATYTDEQLYLWAAELFIDLMYDAESKGFVSTETVEYEVTMMWDSKAGWVAKSISEVFDILVWL